MIDAIIAEMAPSFKKGVFTKRTIYRFTFDDVTVTFAVDGETFSAEKGASAEKADCSCSTSLEMFKKIWYEGYRPGMMDFLGGTVKADNPFLLPQFLKAFGKEL